MNFIAELAPKENSAEGLAAKLSGVAEQLPYPVDALGTPLGTAAQAIAETVSAPLIIAAHSVLAVAAFAAQDKANLVMDGRPIPLSLFILTNAESGDRKSACDRVASAPLARWQRDRVNEHKQELQIYQDAKAVYDSEHKAALSKAKSAASKAAALEELSPPDPPLEPIVICQEPTLEGLQKSFRLGRPSQALFSDEGAQFFGGHAMSPDNCQKTIAGLSKYWDGSPIVRTRAAQGESAMMFDRRLSIHLLLQPVIANVVLADSLLREQGILARFLIAEAATLAGTRLYRECDPMEHPAVAIFHARISDLLSHTPETCDGGGLELPTLTLSQGARRYWIDAYDRVEAELGPGGAMEIIKPMASKAAENANRIAGVFAIIEDSREVTGEQMERAWKLAVYYLQSALRNAQLNEQNEAEQQAMEVLEWLRGRPDGRASIDDVQRKITPKKHRKSVGHIRAIMERLVASGLVAVTEVNQQGAPSAWEVE